MIRLGVMWAIADLNAVKRRLPAASVFCSQRCASIAQNMEKLYLDYGIFA